MKVSKAQVEDSRRAILDAAARLFRLRGFDDVSVAEIMKVAGLTHGAFYGYFRSKADLIAACFAHVLDQVHEQGQRPFDDYAADYLSVAHRDARGGGCLFSSLGTEAVRASAETRRVMTRSIKQQIDDLSVTAPGASATERRRAAIAGWSAMVGAVMLSRISDDPVLARELLVETQASLRKLRRVRPGCGCRVNGFELTIHDEGRYGRKMRTPRTADPRVCSIDAALKLIGEKWALLALREIALGQRRFDDIVFNTGAPRDILAARLKSLEAAGVVQRQLYQERPARYEYRLAEAGEQLFAVLHAIRDWGDRFVRDDPENVVTFRHSCGAELHVEMRCAACGEVVTPGHVTADRDVHRSDIGRAKG